MRRRRHISIIISDRVYFKCIPTFLIFLDHHQNCDYFTHPVFSCLCHVLGQSVHVFLIIIMFPIGVNCPAIVREIPHFGSIPAFQHLFKNVPHFWLYFEVTKIAENRNHFSCTETFCSKKLCQNVSVGIT